MAVFTWIDDIHYPAEFVVRIRGRNPFRIGEMVPKLIQYIMKIRGKDVYEHDVRWDVTTDPRTFYGFWEGKRQEDRWTFTRIRITIQGEQSAQDSTGNVHIRLRGFVATNYTYDNFIQRTFWWFYNRFFYNRQRRNYLIRGKENIHEIKQRMLEAFGVSAEEVSR